jgi:hypothetical protein
MPVSSFTKYNCFVDDLAGKVHDLKGTGGSGADVLKVMLSNSAPNVATHTVRADAGEISGGNGYTSGGVAIDNTGSSSGGTFTLAGSDKTITASGGSIGPFRYAIVYNDTASGDPLIGYWDYASSITLADGEDITLDLASSITTIT